ncbi:MAG: hypothetical protein C4521_07550, partial [Actinobacteria bacterium]
MSKETLVWFLDELARRFGTTAEQLWETLLKQVKIDAVSYGACTVFVLGLLVVGVVYTVKSYRRYRNRKEYLYDDLYPIIWGSIISLAALGLTISLGTAWVGRLINPDFFVLRFIF